MRSLIEVQPDANCALTKETELLHNYLESKGLVVADQIHKSFYQMYAPADLLGHSYGIYTTDHTDPVTAKQLALGHCMAGEATIVSDTLIVDDNVAVTFTC